MCPSPPPFGIGLGPTNPSLINIAKETLIFRRAGFSPAMRLLVPTFSLLYAPLWVIPSASLQNRTLSYRLWTSLRTRTTSRSGKFVFDNFLSLKVVPFYEIRHHGAACHSKISRILLLLWLYVPALWLVGSLARSTHTINHVIIKQVKNWWRTTADWPRILNSEEMGVARQLKQKRISPNLSKGF